MFRSNFTLKYVPGSKNTKDKEKKRKEKDKEVARTIEEIKKAEIKIVRENE